MSTQTQTRPVRFASRFKNLSVTIETGDYIRHDGRITGENAGKHAVFVDGMYQTSDPQEIEVLRRRMNAPDGASIWELAPDVPDSKDTLVKLVTANAVETREILDAERQGWERPDVIAACEAKLAQFNNRGPKKEGS